MNGRHDKWLKLIDIGDFRTLFVDELGWDNSTRPAMSVQLGDGEDFQLTAVAQYKGILIWVCPQVPAPAAQRSIDRTIAKESQERLIIFRDGHLQQWRWPMTTNSAGSGSSRLVLHEHVVGQRTEALLQRLQLIEIPLTEDPTVIQVLGKLRRAFDSERLTKSFYRGFADQAKNLSTSIEGLATEGDREWYSALLLNRLMFIYFMQRKGFMDGDLDYLRTRLGQVRKLHGPNKFFEFYTTFLLPMFHEGLGSSVRPIGDPTIAKLIGDVPYVNGGIFSRHPLEREHTIAIPDSAFESIFSLFDQYQWHLDDRPTGNPTEINPDVLGYIFEQFINNKEQGAYYTKDDVTYYMTASTVLPAFLERFEIATGVNPWMRLTSDPERYVWSTQAYGIDEPLPVAVKEEAREDDRPSWGEQAPESVALPGETWWDVDFRRRHLRSKLTRFHQGAIHDADSAISKNLDLETLTLDMIDSLDSPKDVVSAWGTLTSLKVIDPTCGSGAFLFAALKILEPIYQAVLEAADRHASTSREEGLHAILSSAAKHPSRAYFVLKHAALNNLYGVDLMREAVEIARLRLFLKLVSSVDQRRDLEPLPDLDFNIKPGNTLVGADRPASIERELHLRGSLVSGGQIDKASAAAQQIAEEYGAFREALTEEHTQEVEALKASLLSLIEETRELVDHAYYETIDPVEGFAEWQQASQPFHWFLEFPEVFAKGGFDVVIGNPPYVGRTKPRTYDYQGFATDLLPDIYAPCVERAGQILNEEGRFAMILPISSQFGRDFQVLREVMERRYGGLWVSTFSRNPAALFSAGLGVRSTIVIAAVQGSADLNVTRTHRWYEGYRPALFENIEYYRLPTALRKIGWIRITSRGLADLFRKAVDNSAPLASTSTAYKDHGVRFKTTSLYWLSVFRRDPPCYELDGRPAEQTKIGQLNLPSEALARIALAILSSKFAFVWWYATGDDFDVTAEGLRSTPLNPANMSNATQKTLLTLAGRLETALPENMIFTKYARKWMGNYDLSQVRSITDQVDRAILAELGAESMWPALEHAYHCAFKPTGDRPGTIRFDPFRAT